MRETAVAYETETDLPFDQAVQSCRDALAREGFGVLTEIDVQATLKKKLDVDRDPYLILGACHPPSAHRALTAMPEVGVLLPCNVTVSRENGKTVVRAMNPKAAHGILAATALDDIACDAAESLRGVTAAIKRAG